MNKIFKAGIVGMAILFAGTAPILPTQLKWTVSYEAAQFDTTDGTIHSGEYSVQNGSTYVFEDNQIKLFPDKDTRIKSLAGMTQVHIIGKRYVDRFENGDEVSINKSQYDQLKVEARTPQKMGLKSVLSATVASADIAFDATANAGNLTAVSSATFSHTITGANNVLVVAAAGRTAKTDENNTVTGITYNSVAMTFVRADENEAPAADTFDGRSEVWYQVNPASGAHNVVVTWTGNLVSGSAVSTSYTGVVQSASAIDASGGATGIALSLSASITTVASKAWIIDSVYSRSATITANASQTEKGNILVSTDDKVGSSYKPNATAGANTMDWVESNDGNDWAMTAVSLTPLNSAIPTVQINGAVQLNAPMKI